MSDGLELNGRRALVTGGTKGSAKPSSLRCAMRAPRF